MIYFLIVLLFKVLFVPLLTPTVTVLAYDLHCLGYQAVDIEYEWFLSNATEKQPINHKYIGEITGRDIVLDLNSATYESQIICYI